MPAVDLVVESPVSGSIRARQVSSMFDVPPAEKATVRWTGQLPIEANDWNVGLVVGPSGCGKSSIARHVWGAEPELQWGADSVIDDFAERLSVQEIAEVCGAVGFNTIPAWLRRFAVLSNGERFRVDLARRLLECGDPIVVDEFSSVVDRQVAQIASHAVQKYVRKHQRRFVAVTCHYDVIDWLQPDWILEPATMQFRRRMLQRRPPVECEIRRVDYSAWRLFAPYHYLTSDLHRAARCFVLFANGRPASFGGVMTRPHPTVRDVVGLSRLVTLPDWQGLGLAMTLVDALGAAYKAVGKRLHTYPAHPSLIRTFDRSRTWRLERRPGSYVMPGTTSTIKLGGRPCAMFAYAGAALEPRRDAERLLEGL